MYQEQYLQSSPELILYKLQNTRQSIDKSKHHKFDSLHDQQILKSVQQLNFFEDDTTLQEKEKKVDEIKRFLQNWLLAIRQNQSNGAFTGDILLFGSYRLGVNAREGDVDMIMLGPVYADRDLHFNNKLPTYLKGNPKISDLLIISEAMVPLIRFRYERLQVDLIFAQIKKPHSILSQSETLDDKSARSINGLKVSDYFAVLYTERNANLFLKAVKLWVNNRGIYGGVMGYLGGISCQILATKIIQLYPQYSVGALLDRFFFIYSQWRWNDMPVMIQKCEDVWRSSYFDQQQQKETAMIILTPEYPSINSTHNVSNSTLAVIKEQLHLGYVILQKIKNQTLTWNDLFKKIQFFDRYEQYLQIRALAKYKKDLMQWKSHIESRLRKLNKMFDEPEVSKYLWVHLYPKSFETDYQPGDENDCAGKEFPYSESYYYGLKAKSDSPISLDFDTQMKSFCECLEGTKPYLIIPQELNIQIRIQHRAQIPKKLKSMI